MIKVNANSGLQTLLNPAHIRRVSNDGEIMWFWMSEYSFSFHLSESDGDGLLSHDRYQALWLQLQEL